MAMRRPRHRASAPPHPFAAIRERRASAAAETPYSMRLDWDPDDRIFVVTVPELPGCTTHGRTRAEAVRKGEEAIASWLGAAERFGEPIPPPAVVRFGDDLAEGEGA